MGLNEQFSPSLGQNLPWKGSGAGLVLVLGDGDGARMEEDAQRGCRTPELPSSEHPSL